MKMEAQKIMCVPEREQGYEKLLHVGTGVLKASKQGETNSYIKIVTGTDQGPSRE